jgi:hypothetical protein
MIKAHRNLHSLKRTDVLPWVVTVDGKKQGAAAVVLHGVRMHHPGDTVGARRCRGELPPYVNPKTGVARKAERAVFAWFVANACDVDSPFNITDVDNTDGEQFLPYLPSDAVRVHLNPFVDAYFTADGKRIDRAQIAYLLSDGTAWVVI